MTQDSSGSEPGAAEPRQRRGADPGYRTGLLEVQAPYTWNVELVPAQAPVQTPDGLSRQISDEVRRQLEKGGGPDSDESAGQEAYTERKLREAFSAMPGIKSVAYTRKCDEWTLVMLHDDEDKAGAHMRLSSKLCDITRDDLKMPVFETWIIHVSDAGGSVPIGEKTVVER